MFIIQNVLPISGARAYTVSDDASVDQRYSDWEEKQATTASRKTRIISRKVISEDKTADERDRPRTTDGRMSIKKQCGYAVAKH